MIDRIRRNPRRSLRKMASELKVSHGSMQNLVKNDLHLKSCKRRTVHFLSEKIVKKRLARSKDILTRLATQPLDKIIFSDEKLFTIEEATNKQNERILAPMSSSITEKHLYVKRTQKPQSVMVWAGISMGFCPSSGKNKFVNIPKVDSGACGERFEQNDVQQRAISIPARRRTGLHIKHLPKLVTRKHSGFHYQGGMASIKPRFESDELLNLVHIGEKCLCKVTFMCGSSEEVFAP